MIKIFAFLALLFTAKHDYHVAVCEINHKNGLLQITQKIFIDDLEKSIEKKQGVKLLLGNVNQHQKAKEIIGNYLLAHFQLKSANKNLALTYLGYELENEQLFAYLQTKSPTKIKQLAVNFTLLFDTFSDQANLVHFNINGKKQSLFLDASKPSGTTSW